MQTMVFSLYFWLPCEEIVKECQTQETATSSIGGKVVLSVKVLKILTVNLRAGLSLEEYFDSTLEVECKTLGLINYFK